MNKAVPSKNKIIAIISLISVGLAILSIALSPLLSLFLAPLLFHDINTAGLVTILYFLIIVGGLYIIFGILCVAIVYRTFRSKKYALLSVALFFVSILLIDSAIFAYNQAHYENSFDEYNIEHAKRKTEANSAQLELIDFKEDGELDTTGKLKKLLIKLKINSNMAITINNPVGLSVLELVPGNTTPWCSSIIYPGNLEGTYALKPGLNELNMVISSFEPNYDTKTEYKTETVNLSVNFAFKNHEEVRGTNLSLFGQSNAPDIMNIQRAANLPEYDTCRQQDYYPTFKTKVYTVTYR